MSAEEEILARLEGALAGVAVFAGRAPLGQPLPFVRFTRVSAVQDSTLDGVSDIERGHFQVDCFAGGYAAVAALANKVAMALVAAPTTAFLATRQGMFDAFEADEPQMWRRTMDFLTVERVENGG